MIPFVHNLELLAVAVFTQGISMGKEEEKNKEQWAISTAIDNPHFLFFSNRQLLLFIHRRLSGGCGQPQSVRPGHRIRRICAQARAG